MAAAVVVRSMFSISPSAYEAACAAMRLENATSVMVCLPEKGGHINSAGGYLRDLTRCTEAGEFASGPRLMALVHPYRNRPILRDGQLARRAQRERYLSTDEVA